MTSRNGFSPPAPCGRAACTSPAPARSAEKAAMCAAPLMPREPPTTRTVPTERLWSSALFGTTSSATPSAVSSHTSVSWSHSGGMPMGTITTSPLKAPPGVTKWPTLEACSATVRSAATAGPCTAPASAPDPAGDVDAHDGAGRLVDELDGQRRRPLGGPGEAGAEDGVHHHVGHLGERDDALVQLAGVVRRRQHVHAQLLQDVQVEGGVVLVLARRREDEHRHLDGGVEQLARHDEAVTAVVALAGEDDDLVRVVAVEDLGRRRPGRRAP